MIDLGTLAGLLKHRHRLDAYCQRCDRWRVLPLAAMVAAGQGSRRLPITVRCQDCGEVGQLQVPARADTRAGRRVDGAVRMTSVIRSDGGLSLLTINRRLCFGIRRGRSFQATTNSHHKGENSMGACRRALAVIAVALLAALPAQGAMMQAVYTGTMADGYDDGGYFFDEYTNLAGQQFTATFVYDTSRGIRDTLLNPPGPTSSDTVKGGSDFSAAMPMLSALLTINGRSFSFAPANTGVADISTDGATLTRTEHRGTETSIVGTTTITNDLGVALRASGGIVPNLDLPLALTDDDPFSQGGFVFARADGGGLTAYAGGNFSTDSVAIAPVPLPAAAWLLLSGLGGLGVLGRRRKTA